MDFLLYISLKEFKNPCFRVLGISLEPKSTLTQTGIFLKDMVYIQRRYQRVVLKRGEFEPEDG